MAKKKEQSISTSQLIERLKNIAEAEVTEIIHELFKDRNNRFNAVIIKVLDHEGTSSDVKEARRKKLEKIMNDNFDKYDDVFKALA